MSVAIDEVWTEFHEMGGTEQKAWLTQVMSISEQQQDSFIMAYRTLLQGVSSVSFSAGGKEAVITCKTRTTGRHGDW